MAENNTIIAPPTNATHSNATHIPVLTPDVAYVTYGIGIAAMFSLVGLLFMITLLFLNRWWKRMASRLVFYIAVTDLVSTMGWCAVWSHLGETTGQSFGCQWMAVLSTIANNSGAGWNVVTATFVALTVIFKWKPSAHPKFEYCCHLIWPISIFVALIGYSVDTPENWIVPQLHNTVCYISDKYASIRIYFVHFWMAIAIGYVLILYPLMAIYIYSSFVKDEHVFFRNQPDRTRKKRTIFFMAFYPLIFVGLWVLPVISRITTSVPGATFPLAATEVGVCLLPWLGFFNAIWYIYSRNLLTMTGIRQVMLEIRRGYEKRSNSTRSESLPETVSGKATKEMVLASVTNE